MSVTFEFEHEGGDVGMTDFPITVRGSGGRTYEIRLTEAGVPWCTCSAWKFSKEDPKTCKHIRALGEIGAPEAEPAQGEAKTSGRLVTSPPPPAPAAAAEGPRIRPMKLAGADHRELERLMTSEEWVGEQKLDGARILARVTPEGRHEFLSGNGTPSRHTTSTQWFDQLSRALPAADAPYMFDGELLWTGHLWVFDIVEAGDMAVRSMELADRRRLLEATFEAADIGGCVHLLPQARSDAEKLRLLRWVHEKGCEGLVLKRQDGTYDEGVRPEHSLKVKFRKSVDCVVTARDVNGKLNARLAVFDRGELRSIGGCSMIGKPDAKVGDVVEVGYLYATEELTLYTPSLTRIREDKRAEDCTIDQLVPVSKEVFVP